MTEAVQAEVSEALNEETPEVQETATEQSEGEGQDQEQVLQLTEKQLQERLDATAAKVRAKAERKADREIAKIREELQALKVNATPVLSSDDRPTLDQFDSYDEYTLALADWRFEQKQKEQEEKQSKASKEREQTERVEKFADKVADFKAKTADFDSVVEEISDMPMNQAVFEAVAESDFTGELTYHFGKHPEVLDKLNKLSPIQAAREIGKLEAQLSAPAPAKKTSNAPSPITPVSSRSSDSGLSDNLSTEEWIARRNKQLKRA